MLGGSGGGGVDGSRPFGWDLKLSLEGVTP